MRAQGVRTDRAAIRVSQRGVMLRRLPRMAFYLGLLALPGTFFILPLIWLQRRRSRAARNSGNTRDLGVPAMAAAAVGITTHEKDLGRHAAVADGVARNPGGVVAVPTPLEEAAPGVSQSARGAPGRLSSADVEQPARRP